ncbi:MAG: hypothetical protein DRJ97_05180 [Thermoprotei archaeon]|nr:MAG: hypothetical protein DRJ97_05180 [Thermoprotei archaeon]
MSGVVKAVDVERLFKGYRDEGDLAKAEAAYLLLRRLNRSLVADTLYARYGSVRALDTAMRDLESIGLDLSKGLYIKTEDTNEDLYAAAERPFLDLFPPLIAEALKGRGRPSLNASKLLYLLLERGLAKPGFSHENSRLREYYKILYGEDLDEQAFRSLVKELEAYWVVEFTDGYRCFYPQYLGSITPYLRSHVAKVKVCVEPP